MRRLRLLMRQQLAQDWSLEQLGALVDLEPSYLGRRFRRATGKSPIQWLNRQRCDQAALMLLTTDQDVQHIAQQLGWQDANYFARIFRRHFGVSPSTYRTRRPQAVSDPRYRDHQWLQW